VTSEQLAALVRDLDGEYQREIPIERWTGWPKGRVMAACAACNVGYFTSLLGIDDDGKVLVGSMYCESCAKKRR